MDRLAAISDGTFAIILTLLVLELKIPEVAVGDEAALVRALELQIPNLLAWIVSFVLVARFWMIHHDILYALRECHLGIMIVNFVVLALTSLVPFASGLIGTFEYELAAVQIFTAVLGLSGLALGGLAWRVARASDLHAPDADTDLFWHWRYHTMGIPLFALFAAGWALVHHPGVALATWLAEPLIAFGLTTRRNRAAAP